MTRVFYNIFQILQSFKKEMYITLLAFIIAVVSSFPAWAISTIRDVEIEETIRQLSDPIFRAANLPPENVKIYIINSDQINAFVANGMNIFINTGLLRFSDKPEMIQGVIAHETGHISGGHLVRGREVYKNIGITKVVSTILGIAAVAAGSPEAGTAIILGGDHVMHRNALQYSRTQEQAADQVALYYLEKVGTSPEGLLELLEHLNRKEGHLRDNLDEYAVTHPLSYQRISHIRNSMERNRGIVYKRNHKLEVAYKRSIVKLKAFLDKPEDTLQAYPPSNQSIYAKYARAIAFYRLPDLALALDEINVLLKEYPNDPYFHELKGQILLEHGHPEKAVKSYARAAELMPSSSLLLIELGAAEVATEQDRYLHSAINHLKQGLVDEDENSFGWHQLGIAYGRKGDLGNSYIALAEWALLRNEVFEARKYLKLAGQNTKVGSKEWLKIQDIKNSVEKTETN